MKKLSTGQDSTLGNYKKLAAAVFGEDSQSVKFLDEEILKSSHGEYEEVLVDESQMVFALAHMNMKNNT
jgi:hypothetical protein